MEPMDTPTPAAPRTALARIAEVFVAFLALLYTLMPLYGNTGLWIALSTYLGLRGLLLHLSFPFVLRSI